MDDLISRQAAIEALEKVAELYPWRVPGDRDSYSQYNEAWQDALNRANSEIEALPPAQPQPEPLTDEEQRIFLAAMSREEKICRQTDEELEGPVNLVRICREIERKVKGALWGT